MREVWVITVCLALISATFSHYNEGLAVLHIKKEFHRLFGDLYSLCRVKFMRPIFLIGYGSDIERNSVNRASLNLLPWLKPSIWPSVPPDASFEVFAKEKRWAVDTKMDSVKV
ncbi:trafficking protein particle complex II-specific subunit 130 homolog isoform X2 [Pistacia vera]|uniref:trafficking protein particle complex II-specific subunit 130 homolog isoform X2 n=1 Tax=Pistacia vera TaxID=55513 RepID=UPI001262E95F|nr:trafficking protein particle complex II-specific subunit 130 homolog isoform X2 [Pistacia vera]